MLVFFDRTIKLKEVISVARAVVSIIPPFGKVRQLTDLVIFSDVKSYIPEWDTPDYLNASFCGRLPPKSLRCNLFRYSLANRL